MIIAIVVSLVLMPSVLSGPDLCRNPKLNSIAYVKEDIFFFTCGGYYWYVKEKDFPPSVPTGKLPDGFMRGDAAFYCDFLKVCGSTTNATRMDQVIILVENVNDGNKYIEFDIRTNKWSAIKEWSSSRQFGKVAIQDTNQMFDDIFNMHGSEVYVVQNPQYAAVDWKDTCKDSGWSKQYNPGNANALQSSKSDPFDAITVKGNNMYYFLNSNYWTADASATKAGVINVIKYGMQNTSQQFFKFKECPSIVTNSPNSPNDNQGTQDLEQSTIDQSHSKDGSGSSSNMGTYLIIAVIVVVIVVVLVIGIVVLVMRRKSQSNEAKDKHEAPAPSLKAKGGKASKAVKAPKPLKKKK